MEDFFFPMFLQFIFNLIVALYYMYRCGKCSKQNCFQEVEAWNILIKGGNESTPKQVVSVRLTE
jgi:hypothetical protein